MKGGGSENMSGEAWRTAGEGENKVTEKDSNGEKQVAVACSRSRDFAKRGWSMKTRWGAERDSRGGDIERLKFTKS